MDKEQVMKQFMATLDEGEMIRHMERQAKSFRRSVYWTTQKEKQNDHYL